MFQNFGDSSLDFTLLVWTKDIWLADFTASDIRFQIDEQFKKQNISIPFPQRDLHIKSGDNNLTVKCIITHGLNINSSRMNDLATHMSLQGYDVLVFQLLGHRGDFDEMRSMNFLKRPLNNFTMILIASLKIIMGKLSQ